MHLEQFDFAYSVFQLCRRLAELGEIRSFMDRAAPLSPPLRDQYRETWQNLRAEDAPLRIIRDDRLRSAPITHFDELISACASDQWVPIARVVGHAMADSWDDH